ncbi:MAG: inhibitor of KinA [Lentimonas sp.]|jgi:inhibitor of KinA
MEPQFKAIADHALLVTFADEINEAAHATVIALDKAIAAAPPVGMIETVPALVNLLVSFDPVITDHVLVEASVRACLTNLEIQTIAGVQRRVQVCYETPFGPDLDSVAAAKGLSTEAVIKAHLNGDYHVLMYGFSPGYAYLSGVTEDIQLPRKLAPVRDVPAGSVIIAGPQCLVTTLTMPTGWSIIGRSPTRILTNDPSHPFLFDVGDRVTFDRIDLATFERLDKEINHG